MQRFAAWSVVACLVVVAVAACGAPAPAPPQTVLVGQAQAGTTVQARIGDTVRVKLVESFPVPGSSLVWDVSTSDPGVLKLSRVSRDPVVRPRVGNVNYTADFVAAQGGHATLMARGSTTCEAMAKPGCPNQDFTVTVIVS